MRRNFKMNKQQWRFLTTLTKIDVSNKCNFYCCHSVAARLQNIYRAVYTVLNVAFYYFSLILITLFSIFIKFSVTDSEIQASYIGCFNSTNKILRSYKVDLEDNSPNRCVGICEALGYHFAGVEYGYWNEKFYKYYKILDYKNK